MKIEERVNKILQYLKGKKIAILGFGTEGSAAYRFIRRHLPHAPLTIADQSACLNTEEYQQDKHLRVVVGEKYNQELNRYDLIIKSPGVNLNRLNYFIPHEKFTSQTELFLMAFGDITIGVSGTKGKSTTASLIYHILSHSGRHALLGGNIGIPFFDLIDKMEEDSVVVAELSAHQLEYTQHAPHVALLLNIYQEHLDHFNTFNNYQLAKMNITATQTANDIFIYNFDDRYISQLIESNQYQRRFIPFSTTTTLPHGAFCSKDEILLTKEKEVYATLNIGEHINIPGGHNTKNILAAVLACKTQQVSDGEILQALSTFKGLPHRLEYLGTFQQIRFYNDSISTIPEATIAALKTIKRVDTLLLGGFDRGIDYRLLIDYLQQNPVRNIAFIGKAGERIWHEWQSSTTEEPAHYIIENDYRKIVAFAYQHTEKGKSCLLSPAAASYDQFKNFMVRGNTFKQWVEELGGQTETHENEA